MAVLGVCCPIWDRENVRRDFAAAKWTYCICFTVVAIITWLLRDYADDWFLRHSTIFFYCSDSILAELCSGKQVAVRISFGNFSFFAVHFLLLFWCKSTADPRSALHTSLWFWRLLLWTGAIIGFFFVPSSVIAVYAQVARFGAGLFLIFVMVEMVSWFYDVNAWLVENDSRAAWAALIAGAAFCFGAALTALGFAYYLYAPSPSCHLNLFFITWSLVVGIAMAAVLFLPRRMPEAGLLTSGAVFLYASYLLLSALSSEPEDEACGRGHASSDRWIAIVGFFLAIAAVSYTTLTVGTSHLFADDVQRLPSGGGGEDGDSLPYRPDFFHLVFALASMYLAMLYTNWEVSSNTQQFELSKGWISTWVKMGSKWFCELLYCWTVVAPAVLRNRDFS